MTASVCSRRSLNARSAIGLDVSSHECENDAPNLTLGSRRLAYTLVDTSSSTVMRSGQSKCHSGIADDNHSIAEHAKANHALLAVVTSHIFGLKVRTGEYCLGILKVKASHRQRCIAFVRIVGGCHSVIVSTSTSERNQQWTEVSREA